MTKVYSSKIKNILLDPSKWVITILIIGILLVFPVGSLFYEGSKKVQKRIQVEYINGTVRTISVQCHEDTEFYLKTSKGSYYIQMQRPGKNILGKKSLIGLDEGSIPGVINCFIF